MLTLNGLDKIKAGGKSSDFEWNRQMVSDYVDKGCNDWTTDDRSKMKALGNIARCPTFLRGVLMAHPSGLPDNTKELHNNATLFDKEWKKYTSTGL